MMMIRCRSLCALKARNISRSALKPAALSTGRTGTSNRTSPNGGGRPYFDSAAPTLLIGAAVAAVLVYNILNDTKCDNGKYLQPNFVADAIESVAPAVVNITCFVDAFLITGVSSGSGFIVTEDGFIVTNAHVVSSAMDGKVLVTTMNGRKRKGVVHSLDAVSDIALIKLDPEYSGEHYPIVTLGTSSKLRNGEFVVALGSPMQLQNSCSLGIVSATARHASELGFTNNRAEYIQTDAAINSGNSGGPLVNLQGHVIGISVMKAKGADGISFAIPIDTAKVVIDQLMLNKRVIRPYVGLNMVNFVPARTAENANAAGPPVISETKKPPRGWFGGSEQKDADGKKVQKRPRKENFYDTQQVQVFVQRVVPGSPAQKCGIQSGDLIAEVDGKEVTGVRDVLEAIGMHVNRTFEFKLLREGKPVTVNLTTEPEPAAKQ